MSYRLSLNVDPVIVCPYDSNHKIARSRIQRHLVKCEKNFPPGYKQQCPYDATHRFFEHELKTHVESCPMKLINSDQIPTRIPDTDSEFESITENGDCWENKREAAADRDPLNEPKFDTIQPKYTTVTSFRGNAIRAKRFSNSLRRPYGYPESMMLEISDQSFKDETESICSEMGFGRGQALANTQEQYVKNIRGIGRIYRRGFRGRLLH